MICPDREQLFAYAQRMLERREEQAIRGHAGECARCRGVVEEFKRLDALLGEWRAAEPTPWFDSRVRTALALKEREKAARAIRAWRWAPRLAPVVVALVVIAALVLVKRPAEPPRPVARQAPRALQSEPLPSPEIQAQQLAQLQTSVPVGQRETAASLDEEFELYSNLGVLEDYDLLTNFDILSELPRGGNDIVN